MCGTVMLQKRLLASLLALMTAAFCSKLKSALFLLLPILTRGRKCETNLDLGRKLVATFPKLITVHQHRQRFGTKPKWLYF